MPITQANIVLGHGAGSHVFDVNGKRYLDLGYSVVKMKIGGESLADDIRRIESVIQLVGSGERVAVDANGRFDLPTAIQYAKALAPYRLFWYEEAELQAELAKHYEGAMATGENLFSMQDARNLIRYGGMRPDRDWLQFDCALSYGLVEYMRTLAMLNEHGWSRRRCIPHGGHQMSLNIAAGLVVFSQYFAAIMSPSADSRTGFPWKTVTCACPTCRAWGSRSSANCGMSCLASCLEGWDGKGPWHLFDVNG